MLMYFDREIMQRGIQQQNNDESKVLCMLSDFE